MLNFNPGDKESYRVDLPEGYQISKNFSEQEETAYLTHIYGTFDVGKNPILSGHACQSHLVPYHGLTEKFEYCTICDKKY